MLISLKYYTVYAWYKMIDILNFGNKSFALMLFEKSLHCKVSKICPNQQFPWIKVISSNEIWYALLFIICINITSDDIYFPYRYWYNTHKPASAEARKAARDNWMKFGEHAKSMYNTQFEELKCKDNGETLSTNCDRLQVIAIFFRFSCFNMQVLHNRYS